MCSTTTVVSLPPPPQSGVLPGHGHCSLGDLSRLTRVGFLTLALSPLYPPDVISDFLAAFRTSTVHQYQSAWAAFQHFVVRRPLSSLSTTLLLEFLSSVPRTGLPAAYSVGLLCSPKGSALVWFWDRSRGPSTGVGSSGLVPPAPSLLCTSTFLVSSESPRPPVLSSFLHLPFSRPSLQEGSLPGFASHGFQGVSSSCPYQIPRLDFLRSRYV